MPGLPFLSLAFSRLHFAELYVQLEATIISRI